MLMPLCAVNGCQYVANLGIRNYGKSYWFDKGRVQ